MSRDKSKKDMISEEDFNMRVASSNSGYPEDDSPDDTEADAGSEFEMGLTYMPGENTGVENDEPGEITFEPKSRKVVNPLPGDVEKGIPENARVVSSGIPSPWDDLDTPSDTH